MAESVDEPTVLAQVPVGSTPGFAATPPPGAGAGQQLYVANRAAGVLTVVDTATHAVRGTIPIDDGPPQYVAFSPDGTRAYVSVFSEQNNEQNNAVNRVVVVDTLRGGVVASIPVGTRPYALAVTPDATGSEVWVPNHDAASVSIIDTATNTVTKTLPVAPNPHWVAFSPDGTFAYTANHESNLITVLDVATKTVVGEVRVGSSPHSVAVSPTEPLVANVNYDGHSVSVIDTRTNTVTTTIEHVGAHPQALAWAPDGRHLYTANVGRRHRVGRQHRVDDGHRTDPDREKPDQRCRRPERPERLRDQSPVRHAHRVLEDRAVRRRDEPRLVRAAEVPGQDAAPDQDRSVSEARSSPTRKSQAAAVAAGSGRPAPSRPG